MTTPQDGRSYDAIIVGSGAGGSAAAYNLARAGLRVALLDKGHELPRDTRTLDVQQVVHQGVFKSREVWLDSRGKRFVPEEYFNLGGKTKWYGAALLRYGPQEFASDADHQCPDWPIDHAAMADYYQQAEQLLGVRSFECEPDLQSIAARLVRRAPGWRTESLPLGLSPQIVHDAREARHFDGFASVARLKGDAETSFISRVRLLPNLTILTGSEVVELLASPGDTLRVDGVRLADGSVLRARAVLLAAGALHSPRLLQRYITQHCLASRLPCHAVVGRNLKLHLLTAMVAISASRKTDLLRKTTLFFDPELPHSSVQPLGFDGELISTLIPKVVPRGVARVIGERAYGFFLQTEDGAHPDNRVVAASADGDSLPVMDYDARRTPAALREHRQLVRKFRGALLRAGLLAFSERIGMGGTAHASGTLTAGSDPASSVVDGQGRVHGMRALYVVDGSILPRSSRVNPSLTIYAWGLRVSEMLAASLRRDAASAA
jgi:choline dehydrogenase-like flavoprotein